MNKKVIMLAVVASCSLTGGAVGATNGNSKHYSKSFEQQLVSVCYQTVKNDQQGLERAVESIRPSQRIQNGTYRALAKGLVCNGMPVVKFAQAHGATITFERFARYAPEYIETDIQIRDYEGEPITAVMADKDGYVVAR